MGAVLGVPISAAGGVEEAVREADLVVTVTPARNPILQSDWVGDGTTIVAVGSDGPEKQELAPAILARAGKIVVDSRAQCLRLGETHHAIVAGLLTPDGIHGELGEVLIGSKAGREGTELIVCDLTGVGAQDAAMAGAVWTLLGQETD
jgi:ornithine cyclodeaminase